VERMSDNKHLPVQGALLPSDAVPSLDGIFLKTSMKSQSPIPFLLTPKHKRWDEFLDELYTEIKFDFDTKTQQFKGECTPGQHNATRKILTAMGADVEASIEHLHLLGGGCDCEIIINLDLFSKDKEATNAKTSK
jgi:hypothetical protein